MEQRTTAYISLGGNMGDEPEMFSSALNHMGLWPGIRVEAVSACYRTEPQGDPDQPWFTNQAAALSCAHDVTAANLLSSMLALERGLGRVRDAARRNGPRRIDIDLLLFGNTVSSTERLILPHPRMRERAFVLVPLLEIAPDLILPGGERAAACLERLSFRVDGTDIYQ